MALMHDAAEAYVNDIPSPLKRLVPQYVEVEDRVWEAIAKKYGLPKNLPTSIKEVDCRMCLTEKRDLLKPGWYWGEWEDKYAPYKFEIEAHPSNVAYALFLKRFAELF